MSIILRIALAWLAIALATAWVWYRLRRYEKWMDELLPKVQDSTGPHPDCPDCKGLGYTLSDPDGKQLVCHTCEGER